MLSTPLRRGVLSRLFYNASLCLCTHIVCSSIRQEICSHINYSINAIMVIQGLLYQHPMKLCNTPTEYTLAMSNRCSLELTRVAHIYPAPRLHLHKLPKYRHIIFTKPHTYFSWQVHAQDYKANKSK